MRVFSSWRFTRCASPLTTAVLLWLGVFLLCWPSSGFEVSPAFTVAGAPHAEQAANGFSGHQIDGNYFAVFAAEDEAKDKLPRNATLLRTLVFVLFFGTALRWLGVSSWMRRRPEVCSPIRCWFHSMVHLHQRRAVATLLGVFRL
jgi:Na+/H+-dicarboxylate symporter